MQKCCLKKRGELTDQFSKDNMISKGGKVFDAPIKSEESILEKLKQKYDQSVPKWVQMSKDRFDFIKLKNYHEQKPIYYDRQ